MKNRFLWLFLSLVIVFSFGGSGWSFDENEPCTVMKPDRETRLKWIKAYEDAPRAHIDEALKLRIPLTGSYSLLSHLQYTASERNQGVCGNCWAWAGTGVMGIALDVEETILDRLSVQYINSCETLAIGKTCCDGGWLYHLADFYSTTGYEHAIPWSNTNAYWQDGDASCDTPCASISTSPNYPINYIQETSITTHAVDQATAIANIKNILHQDRAVWFGYFLATGADWDNFRNFWWNQPETAIWNPDFSCGHTWEPPPDGGGGHAVLCVGYNDDDPNNSYWIMVNSWGTAGGSRPNGIFRLDMNMDYDCDFYDAGWWYSFYWQTLDIDYGDGCPPPPTPTNPNPPNGATDVPLDQILSWNNPVASANAAKTNRRSGVKKSEIVATAIAAMEEEPSSPAPIIGGGEARRSETVPVVGQTVVFSFPGPDTGAAGLTWDGTNLWLADIWSAYVYKIDPLDGSVISSFPAPAAYPTGLAWDGTNLWVACEQVATAYKLDPSNGSVISSIHLPGYGESDPNSACITWDGSYLWHADYTHDTIYKLDPSDGSVISSFASPGGGPSGLTWDGTNLWHSDFTTDTIYKLDPSDGSVISSFASPASHPWDLAWDGAYLWNADLAANMVYKIAVSDCPITYDVYLGTTGPTNLICADTPDTFCDPGTHAGGTRYYWQVVAKSPGVETLGPVWSFITMPEDVCECDLNHDGRCDMQDWLLFGEDWGRTDCPIPANEHRSIRFGVVKKAAPLAAIARAQVRLAAVSNVNGHEMVGAGNAKISPRKYQPLIKAGGPKVGIVAGDSTLAYVQSVQNYLLSLGFFSVVDIISYGAGAGATLAELLEYDAVLVYNDYVLFATGFGDILGDYVDAGGGVVLATFLWQQNPFDGSKIMSAGYSPFASAGGGHYSTAQLGWYDPVHPIMNGVSSVQGYYRDEVSLNTGAILVASWDDGEEFVATNAGGNVVGISLFPPELEVTGDYAILFGNSLLHVAGAVDVCECDLNHDGRCDMQDWLLFGEDWGRTDCPIPDECSGELYYDTGTPDHYWGCGDVGYGMAVRFTPPSYPWIFDLAKFWPYSDSGTLDIEVHVWDDDGPGGLPGSDLITPILHNCVGTEHWEDVNLPTITIDSGEFYIGWLQTTSLTYFNGDDDDVSSDGRFYVRFPDGSWMNSLDLDIYDNMMIRQGCQSMPAADLETVLPEARGSASKISEQ